MTTNTTGDHAIPDPEERTKRNTALLNDNTETGFWNDQGHPAPWPDNIDEWAYTTNEPVTRKPEEPPF